MNNLPSKTDSEEIFRSKILQEMNWSLTNFSKSIKSDLNIVQLEIKELHKLNKVLKSQQREFSYSESGEWVKEALQKHDIEIEKSNIILMQLSSKIDLFNAQTEYAIQKDEIFKKRRLRNKGRKIYGIIIGTLFTILFLNAKRRV